MGIFAVDGKLARFLNRLGDLIVLNILTIICSIPIFTAGAAMTAMYTVTLRMTRNEDGSLIKGYFKAFRDNFKQATIIWLAGAFLILFMTFDIWLLRSITGTFGLVYRVLLFVLILLFVMGLVYIFALLARFDNTIKNTLKNAAILCVGRFVPAIIILICTLIPMLLLVISYRFFIVDFLLGISGPAYLASFYFTSLFKNYEGEETICE